MKNQVILGILLLAVVSCTIAQEVNPNCTSSSDDTTYLPYPGDCTKYWECSGGDAYLYVCPDGLWWHQEIIQCDYPGDYCSNSTTTTSTTTETTITTSKITTTEVISTNGTTPSGEPTCDSSHTNENFPYPGDCTKYWTCDNGELLLNQCPDDLWWHPDAGECDYPGTYCGSSTVSTPAVSCEDDGYFEVSSNCHMYIECTNGQGYLLECPDGLYFSVSVGQCVYEDQSECCAVYTCS